ncbi:hypothetical protein TREES_T100007909 [Tupaia chinensis]|uniref:Uncharacterized protein n=1 Tax=Tupaia chinensis TaxID=246437 RepID=L9JDT4_TUPCH|nr:hypothetical protein TREES_T100007909 [Tupaia chinensis]
MLGLLSWVHGLPYPQQEHLRPLQIVEGNDRAEGPVWRTMKAAWAGPLSRSYHRSSSLADFSVSREREVLEYSPDPPAPLGGQSLLPSTGCMGGVQGLEVAWSFSDGCKPAFRAAAGQQTKADRPYLQNAPAALFSFLSTQKRDFLRLQAEVKRWPQDSKRKDVISLDISMCHSLAVAVPYHSCVLLERVPIIIIIIHTAMQCEVVQAIPHAALLHDEIEHF